MDLWAGAAGGLGLGLPLLVGACGEESCTVAVAERLDVCGGCLVPLFVETNNHLGVGGFFQVCAVGNEFVAVLDVSVLATGEGVGESDAGVGVIGIDVLNVFGEGAPPCFECGVALADARASAEYEEQLMGGVVLAVAEALAVEGEEVLLAAVFAPPQAARNRGRVKRAAPYRSAL